MGTLARALLAAFDRWRLNRYRCAWCRGWVDQMVFSDSGRVCSDECAERAQAYYAW